MFSLSDLHATLVAILPPGLHRLCVAHSGGLDSTVLLFALARLRESSPFEIRAVHVDHQLQRASAEWADHCRHTAERLSVPYTSLRVVVDVRDEGLEAAARRARYDALRQEIQQDEVLLTAHHADDQLETTLLALLRGAGVRGLSAMPVLQRFGSGWLMRPLLEFTRGDLEQWARDEQLTWVDDPTNESPSLDRNYVRHRIAPVLAERWPSAAITAVRSAEHLAEAATLLDDLAALDADRVLVKECLDVTPLRALSSARRRNVLRYWLRSFGVRAPSTRKLAAIEHDMLVAKYDRLPKAMLDGYELRRHRDLLYCVRTLPVLGGQSFEWHRTAAIELPGGLGSLGLEPSLGRGVALARLPETLQVRFRKGGEVLKTADNRPHRSLKKLLQDANVLPWWRARLPFIYAGDELVAVGDLWVNAAFAAQAEERGASIVWRDKPRIIAAH